MEAVKVAVRIRPLSEREINNNSKNCTQIIPGTKQIVVGTPHSASSKKKAYTYDYLFDEDVTQKSIFEECVVSLVDRFLQGFNVSLIVYGQTNSGKSYTIGTENKFSVSSVGNYNDQGIIPRAVESIFAKIESQNKPIITVSYLELYNEDLVDLLVARSSALLFEKMGLARSSGRMLKRRILQRGNSTRTTSSTEMNSSSSRSHAIFTVTLKQTKQNSEGTKTNLGSRFHFVDLAGSERLKRTNAEGERKKEGIAINQGLLALGNVISALSDETRRGGHVPYRDSKLTRMLQDSLGGNSHTLMLACISPSDFYLQESINTLEYASKAGNIKNQVEINQEWGNSGDMYDLKLLQLSNALLQTHLSNSQIEKSALELRIKKLEHSNYELTKDKEKIIDECQNSDQLYEAQIIQYRDDINIASDMIVKLESEKLKFLKSIEEQERQLATQKQITEDTFKVTSEKIKSLEFELQTQKLQFENTIEHIADERLDSAKRDLEIASDKIKTLETAFFQSVEKITILEDLLAAEYANSNIANDMFAQICLLQAVVENQMENDDSYNIKLLDLQKSNQELEKELEGSKLANEEMAKVQVELSEKVASEQAATVRYLEEINLLKAKIGGEIKTLEFQDHDHELVKASDGNNLSAESRPQDGGIEQPSFEIWNESGFEYTHAEETNMEREREVLESKEMARKLKNLHIKIEKDEVVINDLRLKNRSLHENHIEIERKYIEIEKELSFEKSRATKETEKMKLDFNRLHQEIIRLQEMRKFEKKNDMFISKKRREAEKENVFDEKPMVDNRDENIFEAEAFNDPKQTTVHEEPKRLLRSHKKKKVVDEEDFTPPMDDSIISELSMEKVKRGRSKSTAIAKPKPKRQRVTKEKVAEYVKTIPEGILDVYLKDKDSNTPQDLLNIIETNMKDAENAEIKKKKLAQRAEEKKKRTLIKQNKPVVQFKGLFKKNDAPKENQTDAAKLREDLIFGRD